MIRCMLPCTGPHWMRICSPACRSQSRSSLPQQRPPPPSRLLLARERAQGLHRQCPLRRRRQQRQLHGPACQTWACWAAWPAVPMQHRACRRQRQGCAGRRSSARASAMPAVPPSSSSSLPRCPLRQRCHLPRLQCRCHLQPQQPRRPPARLLWRRSAAARSSVRAATPPWQAAGMAERPRGRTLAGAHALPRPQAPTAALPPARSRPAAATSSSTTPRQGGPLGASWRAAAAWQQLCSWSRRERKSMQSRRQTCWAPAGWLSGCGGE